MSKLIQSKAFRILVAVIYFGLFFVGMMAAARNGSEMQVMCMIGAFTIIGIVLCLTPVVFGFINFLEKEIGSKTPTGMAILEEFAKRSEDKA